MGEEKGGGYSNVAAVDAWNKAYERSRTRQKKKRQQDLWHAQVRKDGRMKLKEMQARAEHEGLNKSIDYWGTDDGGESG